MGKYIVFFIIYPLPAMFVHDEL